MNTLGAHAFILAQQENILSVDGSFFVILLLFIVLVYTLNALLFKPVLRVLDERSRLTVGASGEAHSIVEDYQKRIAHYENTLRQARSENYRQLEERRTHALNERAQLVEQAKAEVANQVDQAKTELDHQIARAKQDLQQDAQTLAAEITASILKRPVGGASR